MSDKRKSVHLEKLAEVLCGDGVDDDRGLDKWTAYSLTRTCALHCIVAFMDVDTLGAQHPWIYLEGEIELLGSVHYGTHRPDDNGG